jgi:hypothetical protein
MTSSVPQGVSPSCSETDTRESRNQTAGCMATASVTQRRTARRAIFEATES